MELSTKVISKLLDMSQKELANKIDSVKLRGDMRNMCFQPFYSNEDILREKVKLADYYSYLVDNIFAEDCGIVFKSDNLIRSMFESFFANQNFIFAGDLLQLRNDLAYNVLADGSLMSSYVKKYESKDKQKSVDKKGVSITNQQFASIMGDISGKGIGPVMLPKLPIPNMEGFSISDLPKLPNDDIVLKLDDMQSAFYKEYGFDFDMSDSIMDSLSAGKLKKINSDIVQRYASRYRIDNVTLSDLSIPLSLKRVVDNGTPFSCQYYGASSDVLLNTDWFDDAWKLVIESDKNAGRILAQLPEKRLNRLKKMAFNNIFFSCLTCRSFLAVKYKDDFEEALEQAKYIVKGPVSRETYEDTAFALFLDIIRNKLSKDALSLIEKTKKYWGTHNFTRIMTTEYDGADIIRFINSQREETIDDYMTALYENQLSFADGMSISLGNVECCVVPCEHEVLFMLKNKCCDEVYIENPYFFNACLILTRETLNSFKSTTNSGFLNKVFDFINELTYDKIIKNGVVFSDTLGNQLVWNKHFVNYVLDYDFLSIPEVQCVCQKILTPNHSCEIASYDSKGMPVILDTDPVITLADGLFEALKKGTVSEVSILTNHINKKSVMGIFSEILNLGFCMSKESHVNRNYTERDIFEITENISGVIPKYDKDGYAILMMDRKYAESLNSLELTYDDIKNNDGSDFASFVASVDSKSKKAVKKQVVSNDALNTITGLRTRIATFYDDYDTSNSVVPVIIKGTTSLDYLKKEFLVDVAKLGIPIVDIKIFECGIDLVSSFSLTTKETEIASINSVYPIVNPVIIIRTYILMAMQGCYNDKSSMFSERFLVRGTFEYKYAAIAMRILLLEALSDESKCTSFFDAITDVVMENLRKDKKEGSVSTAQIVSILSELLSDIKSEDFLTDVVVCDLLVDVFKTLVYNKCLYISDTNYTKALYSVLPAVSNNNFSGLIVGQSLEMLLGLCAESIDTLDTVKSCIDSVIVKEIKSSLDSYIFGMLGTVIASRWNIDLSSIENVSVENVESEVTVSDSEVLDDVVEVKSSDECDEVADVTSDTLSFEERLDSITFKDDFDRIMQSVNDIGVDSFKDVSNDSEEVNSLRLEFKRLVELSPKSKSQQSGVKGKYLASNVDLYMLLVTDKVFCKFLGLTANREYLRFISKYLKGAVKN